MFLLGRLSGLSGLLGLTVCMNSPVHCMVLGGVAWFLRRLLLVHSNIIDQNIIYGHSSAFSWAGLIFCLVPNLGIWDLKDAATAQIVIPQMKLSTMSGTKAELPVDSLVILLT